MSRSRSKSPSDLMQKFEPIAKVDLEHKDWLNMGTKLELILKNHPETIHRGTIPANAFRWKRLIGDTVRIKTKDDQETIIKKADIKDVRLIKIGSHTDSYLSYVTKGGKRTRNNKKKLNKSKRARR